MVANFDEQLRDRRADPLLQRTPAMLASPLGVLKAGGAYAPLDHVHPKERQARMLEERQQPRQRSKKS